MEKNKTSFKTFFVQNIYILSAILVIVVFYFINPSFLSLYSIQNMTTELAPLLPMARHRFCPLCRVY